MTTNQLKYFITAAETLSFTEAGKLHYISQTAITQHIQSLEEQLGVKLFAREKKRVHLTPAGEIFYMYFSVLQYFGGEVCFLFNNSITEAPAFPPISVWNHFKSKTLY